LNEAPKEKLKEKKNNRKLNAATKKKLQLFADEIIGDINGIHHFNDVTTGGSLRTA